MTPDEQRRAAEIRRFYFFLMRLAGVGFGYLFAIGGTLFAMSFALQKWRTGQVAVNGQLYDGTAILLWVVVVPALIAALGVFLVRRLRRVPERPDA